MKLIIENLWEAVAPILKGVGIGLANLIPGVSGGTVAVILGIYDRLIFSLDTVMRRGPDLKDSVIFLAQIMLGVLIAVGVFSKLLLGLIASRELELSFLFIGFILGSIPAVLSYSTAEKVGASQRYLWNALAFIAAFGLMLALSFVTPGGLSSTGPDWVQSWWYLLLSGAVASASMVIPGLSGSLLLIILGTYHLILNSVQSLSYEPLIPFMIGVLLGFIVMVRVISWCFQHYLRPSLWAITGFLLGSILTLWHPIPLSFSGVKLCLFAAIGASIVDKMNRAYRK